MIKDDKKIKQIVGVLCSNSESKVHDRHYGFNKCKDLGLKVINLDINDIDNIAEDVMNLYYSYVYTLTFIPLSKIIESNFWKFTYNWFRKVDMKQSKKRLNKSIGFDMLSKIQNYKSPKIIKLLDDKQTVEQSFMYFVPPNSKFISSVIVNDKNW